MNPDLPSPARNLAMDADAQSDAADESLSPSQPARAAGPGMAVSRVFSTDGVSPYDEVEWSQRSAVITAADGREVFRQDGVDFPVSWSDHAVRITTSKYFWGQQGTSEREHSLRRLIQRVADNISIWGYQDGYFSSFDDADRYEDELISLCLNQYASFNSPVWFNLGCNPNTQGYCWDPRVSAVASCADVPWPTYQISACFIVGTSDNIPAIAKRAQTEMAIFKDGSGAGSDNSRLRSARERIRGGGYASGPVSFMGIYDAVARVTKSGGRSRRAAKMEILRCDHPDIMQFIKVKGLEEAKALALISTGKYESDFNGEAYNSVLFQNSNFSVRVTNAFMEAVEAGKYDGRPWQTLSVVTGKPHAADGTPMPVYWANEIIDAIAEGTWRCGDPGVQYDDAIQHWNTCPNTDRIWATNPCSEYVFLDNTACNLASLNLLKFRRPDGTFDAARFRAACRIFITAQEILVDHASYPTSEIALNSHRFRPLGLGYANLGALVMSMGLPYDSDEARSLAGAITAIMTGEAALASAGHAANLGAFDGFAENREPMLRVMRQHWQAAEIGLQDSPSGFEDLWREACEVWTDARVVGEQHGYRNSQFTVIAPTGTIAFMMDCDTTGVEPSIALVTYKNLWGRGQLKLINGTVPMALDTLGYADHWIRNIALPYIEQNDTIEGCYLLDRRHLAVFDCAFPPANGKRSIHWRGHVRMLASVQPFVSGSISKTINMPSDSTVADIRDAYIEGWRLGLKAMAIYRDGSKGSQPVSTAQTPRGSEVSDDRGVSGSDRGTVVVDRVEPGVDHGEAGPLSTAAEDGRSPFPSKPSGPAGEAGRDPQVTDAFLRVAEVEADHVVSAGSPVLCIPSRRGGSYGATLAEVGAVWDILADYAIRTVPPGSDAPSADPRTMADVAKAMLAVAPGLFDPTSEEILNLQSEVGHYKALYHGLIADRTPRRERLPDTRDSVTHKFNINSTEGYFNVGMFPDGRPGELFITMAKEGSTLGGAMDAFATSVSMMLQYQVPLEIIVGKFSGANYDPKGFTKNPDIPIAKSITDYVARWLGMRFLPGYREQYAPRRPADGGLEGGKGHDVGGSGVAGPGGDLRRAVEPGSAGAVGHHQSEDRRRQPADRYPRGEARPAGVGVLEGVSVTGSRADGLEGEGNHGNDRDRSDAGCGDHLSVPGIESSQTPDRASGGSRGSAEQGHGPSGRQADGVRSVVAADGAVCDVCGQLMVRRFGMPNCYVCDSCGNTFGACS
jgi:ribonucleoside-diphosphate reductase alpha chain